MASWAGGEKAGLLGLSQRVVCCPMTELVSPVSFFLFFFLDELASLGVIFHRRVY